MDKRALFTETLTSFVEYAATKGNEVSKEDVILHFRDLIDDESQYDFIYDYLSINKIKVREWKNSSAADMMDNPVQSDETQHSTGESEEEIAFIKMYLEDLNSIPVLDDSEKSQLISELLNGNLNVVNRLVEGHLHVVAKAAKNFCGQGVTFGDLIQEGNIGLMVALSDYNSDSGDFDTFIIEKINATLNNTINTQVNSDRIGQHLADQLNRLDTTTQKLSEQLGRVPEIKELAQEMGISEDQVSVLLKTSLDTLAVNNDE